MKLKYAMAVGLFVVACLFTGCSTGYRSELTFAPLGNSKFKLGVKVVRISKTPISSSESLVWENNDIIWDIGKPHTTKTLFGNEQSGVFVTAFVPEDQKSDLTYGVELKENGNVKLSSNFAIKQKSK